MAEDVPSLEDALSRRDLRFLHPTLVEARRAELSERHPGERFLRRMLDFEAPVPDEPPADLDLPERFGPGASTTRLSARRQWPGSGEDAVGAAARQARPLRFRS